MCGKFTQMMSWREVVDWSGILDSSDLPAIEGDQEELRTPTRRADVLHLDAMSRRTRTAMRWGFPGGQACTSRDPPKFIHARAETIDQKPTFAESFRERRGILPVQSFNEGQTVGGKIVQYRIRRADGRPIGIPVIWREFIFADTGEVVPCFAMVTVPSNAALKNIATEYNELIAPGSDRMPVQEIDRMPATLRDADWALYLGETDADLAAIKAMLLRQDEFVAEEWVIEKEVPARKPARPSQEPTLF